MNKSEKDELIAISNHLFVETSLFTKSLGLKVESMEQDTASMSFKSRDDLTGSERTMNLHGGVIASVMDITGSLVVFSNIVYRVKGDSVSEKVRRISRINTIDLRVDYLRPGAGASFLATAYTLRTGRTVAVSRIELHDENERLFAVGTGSYIISVRN
ncbi:MAG: thioesterase family protein [Dehalococcoidia bacterium]